MQPVPYDILAGFDEVLKQRNIPNRFHNDYRKWLRYFLDFRAKYAFSKTRSEQVRSFVEKLRLKGQAKAQQSQAARAVSLFFAVESRPQTGSENSGRTAEFKDAFVGASAAPTPAELQIPRSKGGKRFEWRCLRKTESPAWDRLIEELAAEIKTRHYSRKTLKHYADWTRKFQSYLNQKAPEELSSIEVKNYLMYLAVSCKVSSSTQNLAFNALLFLYRHILKKDFGIHKDIPRAKKSHYIPTVLSRKEIDAVLDRLAHPYKLIANLQYGCGLRISEGCKLRVKDFNFETGLLTVRGKGDKTRTVPIPQRLVPELHVQLGVGSYGDFTKMIFRRGSMAYFWMTNWRKSIREPQRI